MTGVLEVVTGLLGGSVASAAASGSLYGGAAAAGTGLSISSILAGVTTVGGLVASIMAGNQQADMLKEQAKDAEEEAKLETIDSVDRKRSLLAAAQEAVGEIDVAHAASGVDLSFGSANEARRRVFRETDLGLTSDSATTQSRINRLQMRAAGYRRMAKSAKLMSRLKAGTMGVQGLASIYDQV